MLFIIYINDLDENVGGMVSKFSDYTKIGGAVNSQGGYQNYKRIMIHWANKWQMEINSDKYKISQFGKANQSKAYIVNEGILRSAIQYKSGVHVLSYKSGNTGGQGGEEGI